MVLNVSLIVLMLATAAFSADGQEFSVLESTIGTQEIKLLVSYEGKSIVCRSFYYAPNVFNSEDSTMALVVFGGQIGFVPGWLFWDRGVLFSQMRNLHGQSRYTISRVDTNSLELTFLGETDRAPIGSAFYRKVNGNEILRDLVTSEDYPRVSESLFLTYGHYGVFLDTSGCYLSDLQADTTRWWMDGLEFGLLDMRGFPILRIYSERPDVHDLSDDEPMYLAFDTNGDLTILMRGWTSSYFRGVSGFYGTAGSQMYDATTASLAVYPGEHIRYISTAYKVATGRGNEPIYIIDRSTLDTLVLPFEFYGIVDENMILMRATDTLRLVSFRGTTLYEYPVPEPIGTSHHTVIVISTPIVLKEGLILLKAQNASTSILQKTKDGRYEPR